MAITPNTTTVVVVPPATPITPTNLESGRHESNPLAVAVKVSDDDDLVTSSDKALRQLVDVTFHPAHVGVEEVSRHTNVVTRHDLFKFSLSFFFLTLCLSPVTETGVTRSSTKPADTAKALRRLSFRSFSFLSTVVALWRNRSEGKTMNGVGGG